MLGFLGRYANMRKDEIILAVKNALEDRGLTASEASMMAVGSDSLIANLSRERYGSPKVDSLNALAEVLGLELYFGPPRVEAVASETEIDGARFATVARFDASAAAGNGAINLEHQEPVDHLAFSREWLTKEGINPGSCALITAIGDSMAPTIFDGDLIMLDRRRTAIRSGRVFVFNDPSGGTLVKRLEIVEGAAIIARSDNPANAHSPINYLGQDMNAVSGGVLGEVIWSGHRWS